MQRFLIISSSLKPVFYSERKGCTFCRQCTLIPIIRMRQSFIFHIKYIINREGQKDPFFENLFLDIKICSEITLQFDSIITVCISFSNIGFPKPQIYLFWMDKDQSCIS